MKPPMSDQDTTLTRSLPWLMAVAAWLVYLVTLASWVTLDSLPWTAQVLGWNWWNPLLEGVTAWLVHLPARLLPPIHQTLGLNVITSLWAAGTLWLFTRSVLLLPQDRTQEQRQRTRGANGLITVRLRWLPPVAAAAALAFQATFWEQATAATGEMVHLFLFAYAIRNLLEYRQDSKPSWLWKAALAVGIGTTGNWAMIGYLPLFLVAGLWIGGRPVRSRRSLGILCGCFLSGLLLYLILPWMVLRSGFSEGNFTNLLRTELGMQRTPLVQLKLQFVVLFAPFTFLPLILLSHRWKSHTGETNAMAADLNRVFLRILHVFFAVLCGWIFTDPNYSPRGLGVGLPFLTFYYICALCFGYYLGFALVVLPPQRQRLGRKPPGLTGRFQAGVAHLLAVAGLGLPGFLIWKNLPTVQFRNGPALQKFAADLGASLPAEPTVLIGQEPWALWLLEGWMRAHRTEPEVQLTYLPLAGSPAWHRQAHRRYGDAWPPDLGQVEQSSIPEPAVDGFLLQQTRERALASLDPLWGRYLLEHRSWEQNRLLGVLRVPDPDSSAPPAPTAGTAEGNREYWLDASMGWENFQHPARGIDQSPTWRVLSQFLGRAANQWGVQRQRNQDLEMAIQAFELAAKLAPANSVVRVNLEAARHLKRSDAAVNPVPWADETWPDATPWVPLFHSQGELNEPRSRMSMGLILGQRNFMRQATLQLESARQLRPLDPRILLALAELRMKAGQPRLALAILGDIERPEAEPSPSAGLILRQRLFKAQAHAALGDFPAAETAWEEARTIEPDSDLVSQTRTGLLLAEGRFAEAETRLRARLAKQPGDSSLNLKLAATLINQDKFDDALMLLDELLQANPESYGARINRALVLTRQKRFAEALTEYQRLEKQAPRDPRVLFGLATAADGVGNTSAAQQYFQSFLDHAPDGLPEKKQARERLENLSKPKPAVP